MATVGGSTTAPQDGQDLLSAATADEHTGHWGTFSQYRACGVQMQRHYGIGDRIG
jgi:hypothetical protein